MSSVLNFIKNLPELSAPSDNVVNDIHYVRKSSSLVKEALQKGYDVMQMPNGDVHITETKVVTYKYEWDSAKSKFTRASAGIRSRKSRRLSIVQNADNQNTVILPLSKIA